MLCCFVEELNSINSENLSNNGETASSGASGDNGEEWDSDVPAGGEMELGDMPGVRYDAREQLLSPEIQEEASYQYGQLIFLMFYSFSRKFLCGQIASVVFVASFGKAFLLSDASLRGKVISGLLTQHFVLGTC